MRALSDAGGRAWFAPGGGRLITCPWGDALVVISGAGQTNHCYIDSTTTALSAAARRERRHAGSFEATRESLLARLKDPADQESWQQFFDTYGGVIHALARKAGLSGNEADDVLQETLLSVAAEMPGFRYDRERGSFKGWLFLVTRRRIADLVRKRVRQQRLELIFRRLWVLG